MTYYKSLTNDYAPIVAGEIYPGEFDNNLKNNWCYSVDEYARQHPEDWAEVAYEEYLNQERLLKETAPAITATIKATSAASAEITSGITSP